MDFKTYEDDVRRTLNPELNHISRLMSAALGLCGEAGEAADHVKKWIEQGRQIDDRALLLELGDVLYYVTLFAKLRGSNLETVAQMNIEKRLERYPQGFDIERSINRKE